MCSMLNFVVYTASWDIEDAKSLMSSGDEVQMLVELGELTRLYFFFRPSTKCGGCYRKLTFLKHPLVKVVYTL